MFLHLPRKCVVVLEDIDSAGIGREQVKQPAPAFAGMPAETVALMGGAVPPFPAPGTAAAASGRGSHGDARRNNVTLHGLLNAIDGNASQEGRLLIMTSNTPDVLDGALIRPGRVDRKVYFGNMNKSAVRSMFMRLIGRSALTHDAVITMVEVEKYADEFADKVPSDVCKWNLTTTACQTETDLILPTPVTPAEVQEFLQICRGDPEKALTEIDAWVIKNRGEGDASHPESDHTAPPEPESFVTDLPAETRELKGSDTTDSL